MPEEFLKKNLVVSTTTAKPTPLWLAKSTRVRNVMDCGTYWTLEAYSWFTDTWALYKSTKQPQTING
jgi:hypothetical protein